QPDALRGRQPLGKLLFLAEQDAFAPVQVAPQVQPLEEIAEPVVGEDGHDLQRAAEVAQQSQRTGFQSKLPKVADGTFSRHSQSPAPQTQTGRSLRSACFVLMW